MPDESKLPEIGETIGGRFQILEKIGSGGFGTVYRAIQENIGREVALKFLTPGVAKHPANVKRFRREAFHVSKLRHPNTITLYDYGQTDEELIYMVMELIDGTSLVDEIERVDGLSTERGANIYEQILKSLSEAHGEGLVHRDLKPENIFLCEMFGEQDYVKVLDFGVAKMTFSENRNDDSDDSLTQVGDIFGTPMYMAPEQADERDITPATDVYALGLLLYEMLTARPPVLGQNRVEVINKQLREPVPKLTTALKKSPLGKLIETACSKNPEDRFKDANELLSEFRTAMKRIEVSSSSTEEANQEELDATVIQETFPAPLAETEVSDDPDATVAEPPPIPSEEIAAKKQHSDEKLIGRKELLKNILTEIPTRESESEGSFVLLEGETGIGKSAIVEQIGKKLRNKGVKTGVGHFRRNSLPMEAMREAIIDAWNLENASRESIQNKLETQLANEGEFSTDELSFLSDFFARTGIGGLQVSDSSDKAGALFALFERLFRYFANRNPITVVLEDTHQADGTTLRFLEYLAVTLKTRQLPLSVILTRKPPTDSSATKVQQHLRSISTSIGDALSRFSINPLEGDHLSRFLDTILPMEPNLRERIAWLSQGIPLQAIQIIQYLQNEEALVDQNGKWELKTGNPREIQLPPDLLEFMELRLQQVIAKYEDEFEVRQLLEWCAILGMTVPVKLLQQILDEETNISSRALERGLKRLSDEGIIAQISEQDLITIEFQNNLLREAILENLDARWSNRRFHQVAARQKFDFYRRSQLDVPLVEIADHWRQAGETQKYRDTLYESARKALDHFDLERARRQYLELSDTLEQQGIRNLRWQKTQLALAEIAQRLGKLGQAEQYYLRAAEDNSPQNANRQKATALRGLGDLLNIQSRYTEADERYRQALDISGDLGEKTVYTKALIGLSETKIRQGDRTKQDTIHRELESIEQDLCEPGTNGQISMHLAEVAKRRGDLRERYERLENAKKQLENSRSKDALSDCLIELGSALLDPTLDRPNRLVRAQKILKQALELKRSLGDRLGVAKGYRYLGQLEYRRENYDTSEELLNKGLQLHRALDIPFRISATLNDLGIVHLMRLNLDKADDYFRRAIKQLQEVGDPVAESNAVMNRGLVAINRQQITRGERLFKKAKRMKQSQESEWAIPDLQNNLAFIRLWRGEFDKAETFFRRTLERADSVGSAEEKAVARSYLGLLYCFTGQLQAAALEIGRSKADAEDLQSRRLLNLCRVNAAFYAKLDGTDKTARELLSSLYQKTPFNELAPDVWLGLIENMHRERLEYKKETELSSRLEETIDYFFNVFSN